MRQNHSSTALATDDYNCIGWPGWGRCGGDEKNAKARKQIAYPYVPVRFLLKDRYESLRYISKIEAPLLILHGARDEVIPLSLGQALFRAARQPKKIVVFPDGNHENLYSRGAMREVRKFIQNLRR